LKGSAAQVGLQRIARIAHRAEDLMGKLREGELQPTPDITDICLECVDVLKHFLYSEWRDEAHLQSTVKVLLRRIARFAPEQNEDGEPEAGDSAPQATPFESADDILEGVAAPAGPIAADAQMRAPDSELQLVLSAAAIRQESAASAVHAEDPEPEFIARLRSKETAAAPVSQSVRIGLERLDSMLNAVGELVINRTRMLGRLSELESLADVLNFSKGRMSDKIENFQEKYEFGRLTAAAASSRNHHQFWGGTEYDFGYAAAGRDTHAEFSELEMDRYDDFSILSRSLAEISADLTEVLTQLDGFVRRIDQDIDEFTKLAHRLQDEISEARMVPIGNLYTRLSRTLRDAAKASGKQADLKLVGAETELDNNIIQQISDPLVHLVRNSVAHGIETPEARTLAGKPEQGTVTLSAYHRGNHIFIDVEDDGGGIDFDRVRSHAIDAGIINAADAAGFSDADLLQLLFHPGFSTASRKTELAGRGVGLDVVKANVEGLNGEVAVDTHLGIGSRFTLKVPLTLIISQALFLRCGKHTFAIPITFVEEIRLLPLDAIEEVDGKLVTKVRDVMMEAVRVDTRLGLPPMHPAGGAFRLVVVNAVCGQVGLIVEEVLRKDEIVVKSLGDYMRNVKLYSGATIAPDGSLILLLDVNRLVSRPELQDSSVGAAVAAAIPQLVMEP
ncbi:MAG: chemotaxis protein CheA, partial [Terriglobales bacterium]